MDLFILLMPLLGVAFVFKMREERRRVMLLATHLQKSSIERLMERITNGYTRALEAPSPVERDVIWTDLRGDELQLAEQYEQLAASVAREPKEAVRMLRIALPWIDRVLPQTTFDLTQAFRIHAVGLQRVAANENNMAPGDRAYQLLAEMLLMQHTCHWFCRSKTIASARLVARHHTAYEQVVQTVSPETRKAYLTLVG